MSQEHHHEQAEHNERDKAELESAAREQLEQLRHNESSPENDSERRAESAREFINQQEHAPEPASDEEKSPSEPAHRHPLLHHKLNYADTMRSLQRHLAPASRTFSKVIHTPAIEKTSEALEKTVARPSVVAGATWTALIVGGLFYFAARHYGFQLSGSELLVSFVVGAVIGIVLEGLWRSVRHH